MRDIRVRLGALHPDLAAALGAYLSAQGDIYLVENGDSDVIVVSARERPNVAALSSAAAILVIGPSSPDLMISALEDGATGYLEDGSSFEEIRDAVRSLAAGEAILPPYMLGSLLRYVIHRQRATRADLEMLSRLTERERDVFDLLAKGLDRDAIAEKLFISVGTVRTHLQRLFLKLEIHTHAEVVALAARCGLMVNIERENS